MLPFSSQQSNVTRLSCLQFETFAPIQLLDITDRVAELVRDARLREGLVSVFSRHTTLAVRVQEAEPLLIEDFKDFLAQLAPRTAAYRHNDFSVRTEHMHPGESPNGHSHCLHLLLGSSESIPVADSELQLGTWQRLFAIELDGPRADREILVQTLGVIGNPIHSGQYALPFNVERNAA